MAIEMLIAKARDTVAGLISFSKATQEVSGGHVSTAILPESHT